MAAMAAAQAAEAKKEQEEETAGLGDQLKGIVRACCGCLQRCSTFVTKGSPPAPCEEVQELLKSLKIKPGNLLQLYAIFYNLRERVKDNDLSSTEIYTKVLHELITERRQWVETLLKCILRLGNCQETMSWDKFLWILLRFCSLNRVELGQALFVIIAKEVDSPTLHYLTSQELQDFYSNYKNCPVKSFNTESMDFDKLPLTRFYPSDFCEVVMRFPRLLNPLIHLQLSLQAHLPSSAFWDNFDQSSFCRKITFEFFVINSHRVFLRGEPPFRETCDMLAPEALGAQPVNPDQWILRTSQARSGKGLRQFSVWGEQPPPEILDLLPHSSQGPAAMQNALAAIARVTTTTVGVPQTEKPQTPAAKGVPALPSPSAPNYPVAAWSGRPNQPPQSASAAWSKARAAGVAGEPDPAALTLAAATFDEEDAWPIDVLPPSWMKNCTCAPAPVRRGPDPPLPAGLKKTRPMARAPVATRAHLESGSP